MKKEYSAPRLELVKINAENIALDASAAYINFTLKSSEDNTDKISWSNVNKF